MANGTSSNVEAGTPGVIYAAAIGTTEPTDSTTALPSAWYQIGYTDNGSDFNYKLDTAKVEVEEELDPIAYKTTGREGSIKFAMAEATRRNLALAMNTGAGQANGATTYSPPDPGAEVRIMLVWQDSATTPTQRIVMRQCLQTGQISVARRKGNTKATIPVEFVFEKPSGLSPVAILPTTAGLI